MHSNRNRPAGFQFHRREYKNKLNTDTKEQLKKFLERDDNSRPSTGKRETITRKKIKMQKRFFNDSLYNLFLKFKREYPHAKLSYAEFCKNRPFWVLAPSAKDRETCLCKTHANTQLMADKLFHHKVIASNKIDRLMESLCCDKSTKRCMYRECDICQEKQLETREFDSSLQTHWFSWRHKVEERERKTNDGLKEKINVHLTVKEKTYGTLQILLEDFTTALKDKFGRQTFNIQHQHSTLRHLKENVHEDEIIIQIDFAENYQGKYASEVQAAHFGDSHKQITLHTGVAYTTKEVLSLCSISSSMRHDPSGIWAHLAPVLSYLKEQVPSATTLHVISDGPTTQYRSKKNFFLLSTVPFDLGFQRLTWNFLEAGHGKGPADGVGAAVKRQQMPLLHGEWICHQLRSYLKRCLNNKQK